MISLYLNPVQKSVVFYLRLLSEKLWFRPLVFCLVSVAIAILVPLADRSFIGDIAPDIERSSVEHLLSTLSATMLVIAIFAVGAMISSFSAASTSATPRSFPLIISDDLSQNALSAFIGSFIFSIVASISLKNDFYGEGAYFTLFVVTLLVFLVVIFIFVRWVDRISKLGRLGHTIQKIETATQKAMRSRLSRPWMGGIPITDPAIQGFPVYSSSIGYVQHINMDILQKLAADSAGTIRLNCQPGTFISPVRPLFYLVRGDDSRMIEQDVKKAFIIHNNRSFHEDPRFGLIALSEIASRALSPGVNDPGTAIAIITSHIRLFSEWLAESGADKTEKTEYDRVEVPSMDLRDMLEDAFRPLSRDGAGNVEVMIRLQKALGVLASMSRTDEERALVRRIAKEAFARAESALTFRDDLEALRKQALD